MGFPAEPGGWYPARRAAQWQHPAGSPGRRRNAIRCITSTTGPATRMLTAEEPHLSGIHVVTAGQGGAAGGATAMSGAAVTRNARNLHH